MEVTADKISRNERDKVTTATGSVVIKYDGKTVEGERASYNEETGEGVVEGSAGLTDAKSDIHADKVEFNSFSELGTLYGARGVYEGYYRFWGERMERLAEDKYKIENGAVTTCELEEPHWRMDARDADVTMEDYAFLKGMVFRVKDAPVLYLPYMIVSTKTKRATGFLTPSISYSDKTGPRLENRFFWAIADNMDATVTHEYMGVAGNKLAGEYRYIFSPGVHGQLNVEYMKETDPEKENDRDLWKLKYDHRHALPWGIRNVVHLDMQSEESIDREYGDDVASRTRRYTDSYATFQKNWPTRNLYLLLREQKSTQPGREDTIRRLPSLRFNNQKQKLWRTPLYGSLESSYISYRTTTVTGGEASPYDVDRADFFPSLSLPVSIAPWLSMNATAAFRSTWYSNGLDETGQAGGESFSREYYTTSLALTGPKFFRIFDTGSEKIPRLKHLVVPSVTWSYLPGYEFDGDDRKRVIVMDGIDQQGAPANAISYSLTNFLLAKEALGPAVSGTFSMVRLIISQSYNIREATREENPETEKRPFSMVNFDLDTRFFKWLMVNYQTWYDIYEYVWPESSLEIGFRYENLFHLALDRSYRRGPEGGDDAMWDTMYVEVNLPWGISADYSVIYDEVAGKATDNVLRARYRDDCWGVALNWYQRKINTTDDQGRPAVEDETKIMFTIELEGVGDVMGSERPPIIWRKI